VLSYREPGSYCTGELLELQLEPLGDIFWAKIFTSFCTCGDGSLEILQTHVLITATAILWIFAVS
jgi:hypothetical protein